MAAHARTLVQRRQTAHLSINVFRSAVLDMFAGVRELRLDRAPSWGDDETAVLAAMLPFLTRCADGEEVAIDESVGDVGGGGAGGDTAQVGGEASRVGHGTGLALQLLPSAAPPSILSNVDVVPTCYRLMRLCLSANAIGDAGAEALALCAVGSGALASLVELTLADNRIHDAGFTALARALASPQCMPFLAELSLSLNQIGDASMHALAEEIHAQAAADQHAAVNAGGYGGGVRRRGGGSGVGKSAPPPRSGTADATAAIPFHSTALADLQALRLDSNRLGDEGTRHLARCFALGAMAALALLDLGGNRLGDDGLAALMRIACERGHALSRLTHLALEQNRLGHKPAHVDKGVATLAAALAVGHMPGLRTLRLSGNRISDRGAKALALAAKRGGGARLRELWLCDNLIGVEGVRSLADAVGDDRAVASLCTLALGGNPGADAKEAGEAGGAMKSALEAAVGVGPRAVLSLGDEVIDGRSRPADLLQAAATAEKYTSMHGVRLD